MNTKINYLFLALVVFSCSKPQDIESLRFHTDSLTFSTMGEKLVNPGNTQLIATDSNEVKSKYVNKFLYVNCPPEGQNEGTVAYFANDQYSTILYDKFRDVFYRLFLPSFELRNLEQEYNNRDLRVSRPYMGVMVLDKDLNVIGEHVFDKFQIFTLSNHFVGEKGSYLSLNNLFHPDYDEDHFSI